MTFDTASTISFSDGKPASAFWLTTTPSTAISKIPPLPFTSVASTSSSLFSAAAARAARGA